MDSMVVYHYRASSGPPLRRNDSKRYRPHNTRFSMRIENLTEVHHGGHSARSHWRCSRLTYTLKNTPAHKPIHARTSARICTPRRYSRLSRRKYICTDAIETQRSIAQFKFGRSPPPPRLLQNERYEHRKFQSHLHMHATCYAII